MRSPVANMPAIAHSHAHSNSSPMHHSPPRSSNSAKKSQWIFTEGELLLTPSILAGMKPADERENRKKGVNFILQVGILLKLPQITLSTASVFLHRFFMRFSMRKDPTGRKPDYHYYTVAAAALWLAAKVEENCRKMKELVVACVRVAQKDPNKVVDEQDKEFWRWRDNILQLEDKLLEGLCFDLSLDPPYSHCFDFMKAVGVAENKELRNAAWAFINDSVMTPICLLFPPRVIAAASIYAGARSKDVAFDVTERGDGSKWYEPMGVDIREIKRACNFMAAVYEGAPLKNSAAEGMYLRTPETGEESNGDDRVRREQQDDGNRAAREASAVSAAGSELSRKRARDDGEENRRPAASASDVPWGGEDERTAKRTKLDGEKPEVAAEATSGEKPQADGNGTNAVKSNGATAPPEAGPEIKDGSEDAVADYKGPVSPDLGGSEEGELDE